MAPAASANLAVERQGPGAVDGEPERTPGNDPGDAARPQPSRSPRSSPARRTASPPAGTGRTSERIVDGDQMQDCERADRGRPGRRHAIPEPDRDPGDDGGEHGMADRDGDPAELDGDPDRERAAARLAASSAEGMAARRGGGAAARPARRGGPRAGSGRPIARAGLRGGRVDRPDREQRIQREQRRLRAVDVPAQLLRGRFRRRPGR